MYKIGVIGPKESVLCFMATGFDVATAENEAAGAAALKAMAQDHAIIYVTEELACKLAEQIDKYKDMPTPAVITIPGASGKSGYGMDSLKKACERAVGMDILSKNYQ